MDFLDIISCKDLLEKEEHFKKFANLDALRNGELLKKTFII